MQGWVLAILLLSAQPILAQTRPFWQLTLTYSPQGWTLVEATPVAPIMKSVRTPGLEGAQFRLDCDLEWLDAEGTLLLRTPATIPLGLRNILSEQPGEPLPEASLPASGVVVVRAEGPASALQIGSLRLVSKGTRTAGGRPVSLAGALPALDPSGQTFLLPRTSRTRSTPATTPGPVSAFKIWDTGPDTNRLVIAVMGDGYTEAELAAGAFSNQVVRFFTGFFATSPWSAYSNAINVYRVDVVSQESGADYEDAAPASGGTLKDTYLDARFWVGGLERCLYLSSTGMSRAFGAANTLVGAGVWDEILVFVNSTKYGGCGGAVGVSSVAPASDEIQLHEFGHAFAGLADEYDYGSTSTNCVESALRNVACGSQFPRVKWDVWVEPGTPIPTPETSEFANVVGAFEGGLYQATGVYRPMLDCRMRTLGAPFCPVCQEAHVLKLFERVRLLEDASPPVGAVTVPTNSVRVFMVQPVSVTGLRYRWLLGGTELAGESNASISLSSALVTSADMELRVVATHSTPLVRARPIETSYAWQLNVVAWPSLAVTDAAVTEGDSGSTNAVLTVTLSSPTTNTVTVNYATMDGTAAAGSDYLAVSGQLVFLPGETTQTVSLAVLGDGEAEPTEVVFVNLSDPLHAALSDGPGAVSIQDNDSPPTVTLSSPSEGAVFHEGETVWVSASVGAAPNPVAQVEILEDASSLGSLATPPYATNWTNVPSGIHTLVAVATDQAGRSATSAPVHITVLQGRVQRMALVSLTNLWRFDATTNDYGSAWIDPAFDDSSWRGPSNALFFSGNRPLAGPKKTPLPLTFDGVRIHSYYYRTHFVFPETPSSGVTLVASNLVDDGAVFYLNGVEAGRLRMPDGPITRASFALPGGYATNFDVLNLPAGSLVPGDNLLAVEVHLDSETSSTTAFGMSLEAVVVNHLPVPASPVLERYASGGVKVRALLLLGTDPDGDTLILSAVDSISAQGGSVRTNEGWVVYTPPPGLTNQDSFGYTVGDGRGGFSVGTATVVVASSAGPSLNLTWAGLTNGQVRVSGSGIPHRTYLIEFTESLSPPLWQPLGTVETDAFGVLEYVDRPPAGAPARFYRTISP